MTSSANASAFPSLGELPGRPCPIAASLQVVGERWALLVVRELWMDSREFGEIVRGTGAPRDRIAARLKVLERAGFVPASSTRRSRPGSTTTSPSPAAR